MADWQQGFRQVSVVSADNFFLKYPLYLLGDNLPFGPPKQLFLESWVLLAIIVALILRAAGLCLSQVAPRLSVPRRFPLAMLVVSLALAATPFANFHWLEFTNSRNIEVGLGFYLLARLYLYVGGYASGRSVWLNALDITMAGCLFADDPSVLYVVAIPVVLVIVLYALCSPTTERGIYGKRPAIAIGSIRAPSLPISSLYEAWSFSYLCNITRSHVDCHRQHVLCQLTIFCLNGTGDVRHQPMGGGSAQQFGLVHHYLRLLGSRSHLWPGGSLAPPPRLPSQPLLGCDPCMATRCFPYNRGRCGR